LQLLDRTGGRVQHRKGKGLGERGGGKRPQDIERMFMVDGNSRQETEQCFIGKKRGKEHFVLGAPGHQTEKR